MSMFEKITHWIEGRLPLLVLMLATIISILSLIYNYLNGNILAYGDAESHINIAKRVVDGLTPGFAQLGGVWLPVHHLLMVPFVFIDSMWRTGVGGAIVSALSFIASAVFIFKLTELLTKSRWIALVSFLIYALNPNILYMQATPMSELPLLAFMIGSIYFFVKWIKYTKLYDLVIAAGLIAIACLIRYDAWFLAGIEALIIVAISLAGRWEYKKIEGTVILFATLAFFGCVLWLLWSAVIFGNPLYFLDSPYSAKSQQQEFLSAGELPGYHNLYESLRYYIGAVLLNVSLPLALISLVGAAVFLASKRVPTTLKVATVVLVASPIIFNIISLFIGVSILFVPGITPDGFEHQLFNIRYGMMAIPAVAVLAGVLLYVLNKRIYRASFAAVIIGMVIVFATTYPITLSDGKDGLSSRRPSAINKVLKKEYDYGYVMFDDFARSANPVELGVSFDKIIYVGNSPYWDNAIKRPNEYVRWFIIREKDTLHEAFRYSDAFHANYKQVGAEGDIKLYKCINVCAPKNLDLKKGE